MVVQALFLCQQPIHIQYHIPLLVLIVDLVPHRVKIVHDVTDPENANVVEEAVEYMIGAQRVLLHTKSMSIAVEFVMEAVDAVFATAKVLISNNYINTYSDESPSEGSGYNVSFYGNKSPAEMD